MIQDVVNCSKSLESSLCTSLANVSTSKQKIDRELFSKSSKKGISISSTTKLVNVVRLFETFYCKLQLFSKMDVQ